MLGEAVETANQRRRWSEPEVEDDGDGDVPGPPGLRGSSKMKKTTWRSFWARRVCVGWPVAARELVGGGDSVRSREGERAEGDRDGGRARGVPGRVRERPGVSWRLQVHRGGRQLGRRWPSATAVLATELLRALAREEDRRRGARWAGPRRWAAQCWAVGGCQVS